MVVTITVKLCALFALEDKTAYPIHKIIIVDGGVISWMKQQKKLLNTPVLALYMV